MSRIIKGQLNRSTRHIAARFACAILLVVMILPSLGVSAHVQSERVLQASPVVSYVDGVTNDNGEFTLPMASTDFDFAVMTIQDGTNGDWHTMENTKDYNNNFWWNTDSQQFKGWIQAPTYHNQPVRVFTVKGSQLISGVTDDNGEFTLPMANTDFDFAVMAVQDGTNGDWHTMENTKDYNNNFWWNTDSQQFKGWIQASAYHNQSVQVFTVKGSQLISGVTNDNGEFTLPMGNTDFDFAVMTVQDGTNGDWHTMENTKDYNNNFWWNTDGQQFKGWIQASAYHNQSVKVFAFLNNQAYYVYLPLFMNN